jgi:phage terminase small subunit
MPTKLTNRQQAFIREYLVDLNASAAARRAGYSPRYINTNAQKLLQNTTIQAAIAAEMDKRAARTEITADKVLRSIEAVLTDATQDRDGAMLDRPSALKALELLGKHLKLFTDRLDLTTSGDIDITITRESDT